MKASNEELEKVMNDLFSFGFVNYFGLQRFGTTSVSTYSIGVLLLQSNWKEAVQLILKPRDGGEAKEKK